MKRLNTLAVQRAAKPGRFSDGAGLYLQVSRSKTKSWIFRYTIRGRAREMGLGPLTLVSLADARFKAADLRRLLWEGIDPIEQRDSNRTKERTAQARTLTFDECATRYIDAHRSGWKNLKHAEQWTNTLATYVSPHFGDLPVQEIDTTFIMKVLEPIWFIKTETADRVRNRIELVLAWATVRGFRSGDNPARWRGHLETLLPKRSSVRAVQHFTALPLSELGTFIACLKKLHGTAPRALEFQILTATRTGEAIGARWDEINLAEAIWVIPPTRMKAKREHRVPLSPRVISVLEDQALLRRDDFVFSGWRGQGPLSNNALLSVIKKRLGFSVTAHGFRSTFRDWAAEQTTFPREVAEAALAHRISDATEAAYRRGDLLLKRRAMMNDWAQFCSLPSSGLGTVVDLISKKA